MNELTPQQRAALALWLLMQRPMTAREMSRWLGLSVRGTYHLLSKIALVAPILNREGLWQILNPERE